MKKRKILLVDDELDFIELMGARLIGWGYDLIKATNGREAIAAVKTKDPDIVILDYMLPDMNGISVLKEIRKNSKDLPVIMFTAYPNAKAIQGSEDLGISAFIPKLSVYSDVQVSLKAALDLIEKKLK